MSEQDTYKSQTSYCVTRKAVIIRMSSDLRQRVIDAAKESFSRFGYRATTMDLVARLAGVGKGTIYTFFESKELLLHHILNLLGIELRMSLENSVQRNDPLFVNLERGLTEILRFRQEQEIIVKLSQEVQINGTLEVKKGLQEIEDEMIGYLSKEIAKGVENGEVLPCNPELIAFLMYKTVTSLLVDWEQRHNRLEDSEIALVFRRLFVVGFEVNRNP